MLLHFKENLEENREVSGVVKDFLKIWIESIESMTFKDKKLSAYLISRRGDNAFPSMHDTIFSIQKRILVPLMFNMWIQLIVHDINGVILPGR